MDCSLNSMSIEEFLKEKREEIVKKIVDTPLTTSEGGVKRAELIENLRAMMYVIKRELEQFESVITTQENEIQMYISSTETHITTLKKVIGKTTNVPASTRYADVVKTNPTPPPQVKGMLRVNTTSKYYRGSALIQPSHLNTSTGYPTTKVEIAPGIHIGAWIIQTPTDCHKYLGFLCYNPNDNRCWFSINNIAYPAFVTKVFDSHETPKKFAEYEPGKEKYPNQIENFYRPPEKFDESKDIRCLTNRLKYLPTSVSDQNVHNIYNVRISDKDNLKTDIINSSESDARLACDVGSHGFLVGLAIREYYRSSTA